MYATKIWRSYLARKLKTFGNSVIRINIGTPVSPKFCCRTDSHRNCHHHMCIPQCLKLSSIFSFGSQESTLFWVAIGQYFCTPLTQIKGLIISESTKFLFLLASRRSKSLSEKLLCCQTMILLSFLFLALQHLTHVGDLWYQLNMTHLIAILRN